MTPIQTVLMSVTDKTGIMELAKGLKKLHSNLTFLASGGTGNALKQEGINFTPIEDYTKFPECFGGRVKTLNPFLMGGILFKRGKDDEEAKNLNIKPIDMVVCNLYDFEKASKQDLPPETLIESMDIGGSTLIRATAKNYESCLIVTDPSDYATILKELEQNNGKITLETRKKQAAKALNLSADYEALLARELSQKLTGEPGHRPRLTQGEKLRYGENPDQQAWMYKFPDFNGIAHAKILSGKALSYNNYDDATVAFGATKQLVEFGAKYGTSVIKHGSLCGYATGPTLTHSFRKAWEGDSKSAFGSIIAFTSKVDDSLIDDLKNKFIELLIAPDFSDEFIKWAKEKKPNLRLLKVDYHTDNSYHYKNISGGMLVQTRKQIVSNESLENLVHASNPSQEKQIGVVTHKKPDANLKGLFGFGIAACRFAKSNAIAIVRETTIGHYQLLGVGSGQPNRVDSLQRLAIPKALENLLSEQSADPKKDLANSVLVSDGFFPFDDSVRYACANGIKTLIQPGGSIRDKEVIKTADELNLCMVFTGERYFSH